MAEQLVKRSRAPLMFMADFETTVYEGQTKTEVWAAAVVQFGTEDVQIFHNIEDFVEYITGFDQNVVCWFHNLRFDGSFIMSYLYNQRTDYCLAYMYGREGIADGDFLERKFMREKTFKYSISDRGQWYNITLRPSQYYVEFRDSLKLLPFSVEKIGRDFQTKHQKLEMEYVGFRYAGCEITPEEQEYIKNDVLVVKEALEFMVASGYKKSTIASCCLEEFKILHGMDDYSWRGKALWEKRFPDLYKMPLDKEAFDATSAGSYINNSYRGGWCYLVKGKENRIYRNGTTADVNSLYPSVMHSESGNRYPVGQPHFWQGPIPEEATYWDRYYFVRIKTEFRIKPGRLPCIQIKNNPDYDPTLWLESSKAKSLVKKGHSSNFIEDAETGEVRRSYVILTLTKTDFKLVQDQYDLFNFEVLDGCWFETATGLFDDYIDKYKKIKQESKGAKRATAKLSLNSLYGKFAANTDSSFKYIETYADGTLCFLDVPQWKKKPGYIPIGSAITSYARDFTIRAAQANYHGPSKPGFIYADTDSIHCDLPAEKMRGIKVDPKAFCCWKLEGSWDQALFVRQKTYLEHIVKEDLQPVDPYWSVKCAGMPQACKDLFLLACDPETSKRIEMDEEYREQLRHEYGDLGVKFLLKEHLTFTDFRIGLIIPTGKLMPRQIPGGTILVDSAYCMREQRIYTT